VADREVRWSDSAQRDLDDIVDHIADGSAIDAERVFDRLHVQARKLAYFPERGRRIPELAASANSRIQPWREVVLRPWRMIYVVQEGIVLVIAIVDCRRDFVAWAAISAMNLRHRAADQRASSARTWSRRGAVDPYQSRDRSAL
jgi:toxin ParE1/3/4